MDITQFSKAVQPNARKSCLTRYETEIRELRKNGYGLRQIQNFLSLNGVSTSIPNLSRFLKKINPEKDFLETKSNDKKLIQQKNLTPEKEPETFGSHDPRALDQIFATQHDLEALSRYEKRNRAEKLKK
jgi:hypothetical protein